jgi:CheY-like chemotaxis protein
MMRAKSEAKRPTRNGTTRPRQRPSSESPNREGSFQGNVLLKLASSRGANLDLFANAPIGLVTLDREGRVRRINHAALAILGETARRVDGQPFELFIARADLPAWRHHLSRAKAGHGMTAAEVALLVGPRTVLAQARSCHLADDGECTMTALVDVTERADTNKLLELLDQARIFVAAEVTPKKVIDELPSVAVPFLGDVCVAELRGALGEVLHTASAHAVPELIPSLRLVATSMTGPSGLRAMIDEALDSKYPVFATRKGRAEVDGPIDDSQAGELDRLGLGSAVVLPLSARGATGGVLVIGRTGRRPPIGRHEESLVLELWRRASLAFDNACVIAQLRHAKVANDGAADARFRILLVEDNDDLREVTATLLRKLHYDVQAVSTLAAARDKAKAHRIDVLISDVRLPDGSGLDLMRDLLSRDAKLKGIAMSGFGSAADVDAALSAGFAAHLKKPVAFRDLGAALLRLV